MVYYRNILLLVRQKATESECIAALFSILTDNGPNCQRVYFKANDSFNCYPSFAK